MATTMLKGNTVNLAGNEIKVGDKAPEVTVVNSNGLAAYAQANAAYNQANNAYLAANNSNLKSGGTISGGLTISSGDLNVQSGNIYVNGNTTYINVATYEVEDPLIYLASNNETSDAVDIGFIGGKNTSGTYSHTGLIRHAADQKYYLFDGLPDEGHVDNIVDIANTTLATLKANIEANSITLVGNTVATAANTTAAYNQANAAYVEANANYTTTNVVQNAKFDTGGNYIGTTAHGTVNGATTP